MTKLIALATLTLLSTPALAQSFATDTISTTPGFSSALDSGPARLATATIDANLSELHILAADAGCDSEEWAGTWARRRSPRLQGATEGGGVVSGPSITAGNVDGAPFSASLASGGQVAGTTADGNELLGYFARINNSSAVWYGVELICGTEGCTDPAADNYDPTATVDDGSCVYPEPILGCTDPAAINWNPAATVDDGTCVYPPIPGCTDPAALNWNPAATLDDGTCFYPQTPGCTDPTAINWNPFASVDDGSCAYLGCTDPIAINWDPMASVDDGSCVYDFPI